MDHDKIIDLLRQDEKYSGTAKDAQKAYEQDSINSLQIRSKAGYFVSIDLNLYPELERVTRQILKHVVDITDKKHLMMYNSIKAAVEEQSND